MSVRSICSTLLLSLALAAAAHASLLIRRTLSELGGGAQIIFVGQCVGVSSRWNDDCSLILTASHFRVSRTLKGAPGSAFTIEELGGTVGDKSLHVSGVPRFTPGEEVLVCARRTELGRWETFGAGQGRFRIVRDPQGRSWAQNNFYRSELAAMAPGGPPDQGAPLAALAGRLLAAPPTQNVR